MRLMDPSATPRHTTKLFFVSQADRTAARLRRDGAAGPTRPNWLGRSSTSPDSEDIRGRSVATVGGAAFFDLDRTLISTPTAVALAATFRRRRLLRKRDLIRATAWQLIFMLPGIDGTRRASVEGMSLLRNIPVATLQDLLGAAMEDVLRPLIYAEPLELLQQHRERGERTYIVSASLQEIVQHVADDLGFDGAVGSTCEIVDGVYTGKSLRACYGEQKSEAVRELSVREGISLEASTGYSDSYTDTAFLELVGKPVAINPDRRLRRTAERRGWPILRFKKLLGSTPTRVEIEPPATPTDS